MGFIVVIVIIIIVAFIYTVCNGNNQNNQYRDDIKTEINVNGVNTLRYQVDDSKERVVVEEEIRVLNDIIDLYGDTYRINVDLLAGIMARLHCMSNYYSDVKTELEKRTDESAKLLFAEASINETRYDGLYSRIKSLLSMDKYDFYMILNSEPEIVVKYGPDWYMHYTESDIKASGEQPLDMIKMRDIMACKLINGEANIECLN